MSGIPGKGTRIERTVRSALHGMGYRFRLQAKDLPGKPDIMLPKYRIAVFVHGCFWHQHPEGKCADARPPRSNLRYWQPKLARNVMRDEEHIIRLKANGWHVLVIWDCETKCARQLAARLRRFLGALP